jgi:peptidoglycan/LPS O-acetylase OafA/YrhL
LENIVTKRFGTNNPLWSLGYEWWYYALFGAAMSCARGTFVARAIAGLALATMCLWLPHELVAWGLVWLVGVGAALYARSPARKPPPWLASLSLALVLIVVRISERADAVDGRTEGGYVVALARALGVAVAYASLLLAYHGSGPALPFARTNAFFAAFSYTLYLVHFPAIVLCACVLSDVAGLPFLQQPSIASFAYFAGLLAFVIAYAWCFSQLTERYTPRVRSAISRLVLARRDARAS